MSVPQPVAGEPVRTCQGFERDAHPASQSQYSPNAWNRGWKYCRPCDSQYRASRKDANPNRVSRPRSAAAIPLVNFAAQVEKVEAAHDYVPDPKLMALWSTATRLTLEGEYDPANFMFLGPAGSGKTEGAKFLADSVGLPYTKVDAASIPDPESWFGTREIIVQEGVSVTKYIPSRFVEALQNPGVLHIDEINRVDDQHRNVLLPILDGTGKVTNPLTGEVVERHKHCFVVMTGNRGLMFTGISAIDPAFMTRSYVVEFDYMRPDDEERILVQATNCSEDDAYVLVRFASDSRVKARTDEDFSPISTREIIMAARLMAGGLNRDDAVEFTVLNAASGEGGGDSVRQELKNIWTGVRVAKRPGSTASDPSPDSPSGWVCPVHQQVKTVPAGVSQAGKPYKAFNACPVYGCKHTEDKDRSAQLGAPSTYNPGTGGKTCGECGTANPPSSQTFCVACGATL